VTIFIQVTKYVQKTANTYISSEFSIAAQNSKQVGVAIRRFVARFGRSKVRALGLVSSGVKKREADRSDVEKERIDTRRDRSGAVRGNKRTQPMTMPLTTPTVIFNQSSKQAMRHSWISSPLNHCRVATEVRWTYFRLFCLSPAL